MRLKKIYLNDFKCFKNLDIQLGRITILTGANSSGKSSIIQSILGALQSSDFPLSFSTNGKYVNLGDFEDISYMHDTKKIIHLEYLFESGKFDMEINTSWQFDKARRIPKLLSMTSKAPHYNLEIILKEQGYNLTFQYFESKSPVKESEFDSFDMTIKINRLIDDFVYKDRKEKTTSKLAKTRANYYKEMEKKFKRNKIKLNFFIDSIDDLNSQVNKKGSYALQVILGMIENTFRQFESQFNYISSFRNNPQRIKFEVAKSDLKVGRHGENYEDQIVLWEIKKSKEFDNLCLTMKELKLFEAIQTKRVEGGNYHLKIKTHQPGTYSSISDVGFGISQFLPIIVADLQLDNESTLIVSQPEIHLHPSVQSEFGDYLLKKIKSTKKNYIIETHSEYLLNKLRLLIVKGDLKSSDIKIHYLSNSGNEVKHYDIEFNEKGQILNAPEEFFKTYMTDVMDIALNA